MTFSELYERYAADVFRFALFLSGDRAAAEDIAAETFARALVARQPIREGTVKAYLLAIARNLYRDSLRRQARLISMTDDRREHADPAPPPDVVTTDRVALADVLLALQELPEHERAALVMATQEGLSHEDIAAALGCSVAAVKVRIHRARVRLRLTTGRKDATS